MNYTKTQKNMANKKTFLQEVDPDITYQFELTDGKKNSSYSIGRQTVAYDSVSGTEVQLRYVPGWSTIIVEDQPEIDQNLIPNYDINFSGGKLSVDGKRKTLVQFLLAHDKNEANKFSLTGIAEFRLIDESGKIKQTRDLLAAKSQALQKSEELSADEMYPYARVLGISITPLTGEKEEDREVRVRNEFMEKALANPVDFLKGVNDPKHKRVYDLILAFEQNIITDSYKDGEVVWSSSKETIVKLPTTRTIKVVDFLADYTLSGDEGAAFYALVKKQVKY